LPNITPVGELVGVWVPKKLKIFAKELVHPLHDFLQFLEIVQSWVYCYTLNGLFSRTPE